MEKVKEKITEVKMHNGWNRERHVKERNRNVIKIIKGKVEETKYPKSVTELLRQEEKRFVQGICYFINKIPTFI
jgi:hypothetical protein